MATAIASPVRKLRLNPFCLPSDTGCRFVLLIVAVFGASLFVYDALSLNHMDVAAYRSCLALSPTAADVAANVGGPLDLRDPSALVQRSDAFADCTIRAQRGSAQWIIGGVAVLSAVGVAIVWLLPFIKVRRGHLTRLSAEDAPDVVVYLEKLSDEVGLKRRPQFLWNPLNSARTGLAFGRPGRKCVALSGGLVTQFYTEPAAFRAVMLHELAHIRNADVNKTYFAVASWYAFLLAALLPFFLKSSWDLISLQLWRVVVLTVLVYFSRNAVLRIREIYADVRASVWDTPQGALPLVIGALPQTNESFWRRWWRVHPTASERALALHNTERLFDTGFWETFVAGLTTGIALPNLQMLLQMLMRGSTLIGIIAAIIFAGLITGIVGTRVWRSSLAALVGIAPRPRAWRLGLALTSGLAVGLKFSFSAGINSNPILSGPQNSTFLWDSLLLVALFVASTLFIRWEMMTASIWLETTANARSPQTIHLVGQTIGAIFLAIIFGSLVVIWQTGQTFLQYGLPGFGAIVASGLAVALIQPLLTLALVALWVFPLAACLWNTPAGISGSWFFLDEPAAPIALPRQNTFQPQLALRAGLWGGAAFCALHLIIRVIWRLSSGGAEHSEQVKLLFYFSQVTLAIVVQAVLAVVVARRVRQLPVLHSLFAGFAAACIMAAAFLGINLLFGGTIDLKFVTQVFLMMINAGALAAMLTASLSRRGYA